MGGSDVSYVIWLPCDYKAKHGASSHLFKGSLTHVFARKSLMFIWCDRGMYGLKEIISFNIMVFNKGNNIFPLFIWWPGAIK